MKSLEDILKSISRKLPSPKIDYAFHELFFFVHFVLYFYFLIFIF